MSYIQCNFQSVVMHAPATVTVFLPLLIKDFILDSNLDDVYIPEKKFKTLYLFHGACADSTSWFLGSNIQRYAQKYNLAVVLPNVGNSFYADLHHGLLYWTFISEELPRYVRTVFPLSSKREDNFVAGLSMGGYGALKLALNKPEEYAGVISLSGVADIVSALKNPIHPLFNVNEMYGGFDQLIGSNSDLFAVADHITNRQGHIPRVYMACGAEDPIVEMNRSFHEHLRKKSINHIYEEEPGNHNFDFWDKYIQRGLERVIQ